MARSDLFGDDKWHDDVIRVVVCDGHAMLRRRLLVDLESNGDIDVMAEAADGEHGIAICRELAPDVAIIGMRIESIGGPRTAAGIREVAPGAHVVALVAPDDEQQAVRAIKAGVTGFVSRDAIEQAAAVLRAVCSGMVVLPPLVATRVLEEYDSLARAAEDGSSLTPPAITDRERAILQQVSGGMTYSSAAKTVGVRDFTARNLAANAVEKLYRYARTEAVQYAVNERLFARTPSTN